MKSYFHLESAFVTIITWFKYLLIGGILLVLLVGIIATAPRVERPLDYGMVHLTGEVVSLDTFEKYQKADGWQVQSVTGGVGQTLVIFARYETPDEHFDRLFVWGRWILNITIFLFVPWMIGRIILGFIAHARENRSGRVTGIGGSLTSE